MPAICKVGRRTIITAEADEEWRLRNEQQVRTSTNAKQISMVRVEPEKASLPLGHPHDTRRQ
jgi:hypothetical protein